jgi:hypothetical protein
MCGGCITAAKAKGDKEKTDNKARNATGGFEHTDESCDETTGSARCRRATEDVEQNYDGSSGCGHHRRF